MFDIFQKHPESLLEGFTETQVSTLAVKERLLVAGGFQGELICKVSLEALNGVLRLMMTTTQCFYQLLWSLFSLT